MLFRQISLVLALSSLAFLCGCMESGENTGSSTTQAARTTQTTTTLAAPETTIAPKTSTTAPTVPPTSTTTTTTSSTTLKKTIEIEPAILSNCIGFVTGAPEEAETVHAVGGGWVRPHPGPFAWGWVEKTQGGFDFKDADEWVEAAQENDVAVFGTIWPYADWDQGACHKSECWVTEDDIFYPRSKMGFVDGIPKSRCTPCNMADYAAFVGKLVERYDGDGTDDMPGLTQPVKHWEVLNEPCMKSQELTFFKGTPEEYVRILEAAYGSIKKACPDCAVVQGGASGVHPEALDYWGKVFKAGGGRYMDVANIHYINSGDLGNLNVARFKQLMSQNGVDKPVWVTEAEYDSESQVDASVNGALKAGASKIFFTRFKPGQRGPPQPGVYSSAYPPQVRKCAAG